MRVVIIIQCFLLVAFPNPIELVGLRQGSTVYPHPIQIHLHDFEGFFLSQRTLNLQAGSWYVGINKEIGEAYVIGVIIDGHLYPIMTPIAYLHNNYGRVKVRIDGEIANVTVPILKEDPLNNLFYRKFGTLNIRPATISQ